MSAQDFALATVGARVFDIDAPVTPDERIADSSAYLCRLFDCYDGSVWWGRAVALEAERLHRAVADKQAEEAA